jgi:hypothetical protein
MWSDAIDDEDTEDNDASSDDEDFTNDAAGRRRELDRQPSATHARPLPSGSASGFTSVSTPQ